MSQLSPPQLALNGHKYTARFMEPMLVLENSFALSEVIAPAIDKIDSKALMGGWVMGLLKGGSGLMANLKNPSVMKAIQDCFNTAQVDGKELGALGGNLWNVHFAGKSADMMQVILWLMEAQLGDFFAGARGRLAAKLTSLAEAKGLSGIPLTEQK